MAAPTYRVELKFGAAWTNVTSYVDFSAAPIWFRRGRSEAFAPASTGVASFTLANDDGRFTPGNSSGAHHPYIVRRTPVRIYIDGTTSSQIVFTGVVDRWSVRLDGQLAFTDVECVDVLKAASSTVFQSMAIEETALVTNANLGACWPLSDLNATTGDQWAPWRNTSYGAIEIRGGFLGGKPGSHSFSNDAPPFMKGSISLAVEDPSTPRGPVLVSPFTFDPASGGCTMLWFKTSTAGTLVRMDRQTSGTGVFTLSINLSGELVFSTVADGGTVESLTRSTSPITGAGFLDDTWHYVCVGVNTAGTGLRIYVDGTLYTSGTVTSRTIGSTDRRLTFGGIWLWSTDEPYATFTGSICGVAAIAAYFPTTAELNRIYLAGTEGVGGTTISSRVSGRIHDYIGDPFGTITYSGVTSGYTVGGQEMAGKDFLALVDEIGHAEGGVMYADHANTLQYSGYDNATSTTIFYTLDASADINQDLEYFADDDGYFNVLTVQGTTAGSVYAEDTTAIAADGIVAESRSGVVAGTLALLEDYRDRELARAVDTSPALRRVTIDLLTGPAPSLLRPTFCRMPLLSYLGVTGLPSAVFGATTLYGHVQGYEVTATPDSLTMKVDLA